MRLAMNKMRAGSLVLIGAGVYGFVLSLQLPLGKWSELGAGAFPLIVSALLAIFGIGLFLSHAQREHVNWPELIKAQWTPFQICITTLAFILTMEALGFLLAATLYVFVLLLWISRYRIWFAAGLAVAIGMGSWYIFGKLFQTPLPTGILGF